MGWRASAPVPPPNVGELPGPAATVEGAFDLQGVVFPAPESYSLSLYAGHHFLVERRLEVGLGA